MEPSLTAEAARPRGGLERARDLALLVLAAVAFLQGFLAFRHYVFEDAYITFRYAENLAAGRGFAFNPGERVLGTTTPLWTLLLAALGRLGLDVPATGVFLSVFFVAATALTGARILRRLSHPELGVLYALLVLWGCHAIYVLTGMETSFLCFLLHAALLAALADRPLLLGTCLGLALLTRYDAAVFAGTLLPIVAWKRGLARAATSALVAGALLLPWLVFAQAYFGSFLPNTLAAKSATISVLGYLRESLPGMVMPFFVPLVAPEFGRDLPRGALSAVCVLLLVPVPFAVALWCRRDPLRAVVGLYPVLLWLGYACIGAPSGNRWHLLPGLYFLLMAVLLAWRAAGARLLGVRAPPAAATRAGLGLLAASLFLLPLNLSAQHRRASGLSEYRFRVQGYEAVARWLIDHGLTDLLVFMDEPGYFAHLTDCRVLDGAGLVTRGTDTIGPEDRRVALSRLIETHRPDALVVQRPHAGFVQVLAVPRSLWVREDVFRERLDEIARDWIAPAAARAREPELGHPLLSDFESADGARGWWGPERFLAGPGDAPGSSAGSFESGHLSTAPALTGEPACTVTSPGFRLDFDELAFRMCAVGAGRPGALAAELVVDGLVVLSRDARAGGPLEVRWPVHAWRGRSGCLRFVDQSYPAHLLADGVRSIRHRDELLLDDFEAPRFGPRWSATFTRDPLPYRELAGERGLPFLIGRFSASSLSAPGRQELCSAPFVLERGYLAFVAADLGANTAVELEVEGELVQSFAGKGSGALQGVIWDCAPWRGRQAVLAVVDEDPDPAVAIGIDALVMYDGEQEP